MHSSFLPSMRTLGSAMPMVGSMVFDGPVATVAGRLDVCTVALTLNGLKYMALSRGTLNRSDSHDVVPWESWMEAHPALRMLPSVTVPVISWSLACVMLTCGASGSPHTSRVDTSRLGTLAPTSLFATTVAEKALESVITLLSISKDVASAVTLVFVFVQPSGPCNCTV